MPHSHSPLTPVTFLERSGRAYPKRVALTYQGQTITFGELLHRSRCLMQALSRMQIGYGDRVAVLTENSSQSIEAHFAIPAAGALVVMLNPWLFAAEIADLLQYSGAKLLIADAALFQKLSDVWASGIDNAPAVMLINRSDQTVDDGNLDYELCLMKENGNTTLDSLIKSEFAPIAINFTSGTTGRPKGVIYSHRAAYLHALGQVLMMSLNRGSKYMWTLPMFHVNGWGHMWACMAIGCTQSIPHTVLTQRNSAEFIAIIRQQGITHLSGAPRLVRLLADAAGNKQLSADLTIVTGGSAPPPLLIQQLESVGVNLIHQYGLNETLGPYVVCEQQDEWQFLQPGKRAQLRARQGIAAIHAGTGLRVVDSDGNDVPHDGCTLGEVVMAGNTVAFGYYNNPEATEKSFRNGLFHSGDMAVVHQDGFLEIRDRIKDLIYVETEYGWENISSIEIENALCRNTAIQDAAVISVGIKVDNKTLHVLVAFVELKNSHALNEEELHKYCRRDLSSYKCPQIFYFAQLPKTSTGKVRKDILSAEAVMQLRKQHANLESLQ